jgi:hypothetical protein
MIIAKTAELDEAVRLDRLRRKWKDLVLQPSWPDSAPSTLLSKMRGGRKR